jgi:hypothetical protein
MWIRALAGVFRGREKVWVGVISSYTILKSARPRRTPSPHLTSPRLHKRFHTFQSFPRWQRPRAAVAPQSRRQLYLAHTLRPVTRNARYDVLTEEPLISLSQAAARFPGHRGADRLHPATLTRWILKGVKALDGRRVKLEAVRIGCRWLTSEPALQRFADALGNPPDDPPPARTPTARQRASDRADAELRAMGA